MSALVPLMLLAPLAGALLVALLRSEAAQRRAAGVTGLLTLALAVAGSTARARLGEDALVAVGPTLPLGASLSVGLDGVSALLAPLFAAVLALSVTATPRTSRSGRTLVATLLTAGAALGVACAMDLALLSAMWIVGAVAPLYGLERGDTPHPARRMLALVSSARTLALLAGVAIVAWAAHAAGRAHPFEVGAEAGSRSLETLAFVLVTVAALARIGIFPVHAWAAPLSNIAPVPLWSVMMASNVGLAVLLRVAMPLAPDVLATDMPIVAIVALVSALASALAALGEKRLPAAITRVASSMLAAIVVGVGSLNAQSLTGALVQATTVGLGITGLYAIAASIEARAGEIDLSGGKLGLARVMPRAAFGWLVLSLCLVGFPGTLSFVGEDLLLHGVLHEHPAVAAVALLASVLNALVLFRTGARIFGGSQESTLHVPDLLPRERAGLLAVVLVLVGTGLAPRPIVAASEAATAELARFDAHTR